MDVSAAATTFPSGSAVFVTICKRKHCPTVVDLADFVEEVTRRGSILAVTAAAFAVTAAQAGLKHCGLRTARAFADPFFRRHGGDTEHCPTTK